MFSVLLNCVMIWLISFIRDELSSVVLASCLRISSAFFCCSAPLLYSITFCVIVLLSWAISCADWVAVVLSFVSWVSIS